MKHTFEQICQGERVWTALDNFMNQWYADHLQERERLIGDPLPEEYPVAYHRWAVFCAASVEWFCQTYEVPCPEWVHDARYTLDHPWYFERGEPEELRQTTPQAFARRKVFCGADIYANKWEFMADVWARYGEKLAARGKRPSDDVLPYLESAQRKRGHCAGGGGFNWPCFPDLP